MPGSYAILFFIASDFTFTTSHIHTWSLFPHWLSLFIPSGAISLLFSSSVLGTYWPGEFIFQCHLLSFHTVHEVLKAVMLKWFVPSPVDHVLLEHSTVIHLSWVALHGMAQFHWVRQGCDPCDQFGYFSVIVVFILSAFWWMRIRGLWLLPDGRNWLWGIPSLALIVRAMLGKSLIQFSADGWACVPSL